jgi:hypothetical protein
MTGPMSETRASRRKKEIELAKERKRLRYQMSHLPFDTEDGKVQQTKIGGATRPGAPRWGDDDEL